MTYAVPGAVLLLVDVPTGLGLALGTLPAAVLPLAPLRRKRYVAAVMGVLAGAMMLIGALLAAAGAWVAVPSLFLLAVGSAMLAARRPFGVYVMTLCVPLVGAGLSYQTVGEAAGLALAFVIGAIYGWLLSLPWPESQAHSPLPVARGPAVNAMMLDYGLRLGLAGASCAAIGFTLDLEHVGWAVTAALIVMRPSPEMQRLRSIGRLVSVSIGALVAITVVEATPSALVLAAVTMAALAAASGTVGGRWYVTPAFTTFLVFLLLLYAHPDQASSRFWERTSETALGVGVACICGLLIPILREWLRKTSPPLRLLRGGLDLLGCRAVDRSFYDGIRSSESLPDLHDARIRDEGEDAGVPRLDRVLELVGELPTVAQLADLSGGRAGGAERCCAADYRRREDEAEGDTADDAPLQAGLRAVVGGPLDLELPLRISLDHDDAFDGDGVPVLDRLQRLVGRPGGGRVREVGDDQGVGAVGRGRDELSPTGWRWIGL